MRRHFIHHDVCSYFVIPNLYSVDNVDGREELRALAINQLAGVLADLNLIRPLTPSELKSFARQETRTSYGEPTRRCAVHSPMSTILIDVKRSCFGLERSS